MARAFDRKFGEDYVSRLPLEPGVYLVYGQNERLIYVGKAKSLRRRLSQYRNAKRLKKHRKMKEIVREAARIEIRPCPNELEACLLETELIQKHRPRWNVAGAYFFLYPMIGMKREGGALYFCYTTSPERIPGFAYHGAFRSRDITREAFFALTRLLKWVGHPVPRKSGQPIPKFSHVMGFRQIPPEWDALWSAYLRGESQEAAEELVLALVENAHARRFGREVQERLNELRRFWKQEARALAVARHATGYSAFPVPQEVRDSLFLKVRYGE